MGESIRVNYLTGNNVFKDDLAFSESLKDEPLWDRVYREAFPDLINHMPCQGKCDAQYKGIDRMIVLSSGQELRIDEKKRRQNFADIALEFKNVYPDGSEKPGWMDKNLTIDYLAYAFMPEDDSKKVVYLLDWRMLKRVWFYYRAKWLSKYFIAKAANPRKGPLKYTTHSVCVPIEVLLQKVSAASIIKIQEVA